jgi:carboxylesterase
MIKEQIKEFGGIEGVAEKAQPFSIKKGNKTLVILTHGFTGSPYELHVLADFLAGNNMDVEVPLLAGHGGDIARLAKTNSDDWVQSLEKALLDNLEQYEKIFLIGYSFGSNLSLHLASKYPQISGIIALGIPVFIRNETKIRLLLPLARIFKKTYKKRWLDEGIVRDIVEQGRHSHIPIPSIVSFYDFIDKHTKKELSKVKSPVLVIHSRDDLISHPRSSEYLFKNLTVDDKHLFVLNKEDHNPVHNTRRDFIFSKTLHFIENH